MLDALVAEHKPEGPTESHLVEELAGIFWRKRRLRLAEASAMREGLHRATRSYSDTGEAALVCVSGGGGDVGEALRATPEETEQELRENREAWEAADKALAVLRAGKDDAYESALGALSAGTRDWWLETLEEWAEEAEPQDASEPGASDPHFGSELRHRLAAITHHHLVVAIGLGEQSAQAGQGPRRAARLLRLPGRALEAHSHHQSH